MSAKEDEPLWSISVKTVGAERQETSSNNNGDDNNDNNNEEKAKKQIIPPSFEVRINPGDNIASLQDHIETVTGLKHSQQCLIYRGRILQASSPAAPDAAAAASTANESDRASDDAENNAGQEGDDGSSNSKTPSNVPTKISEIKGLGDGHTIHLVRRQESQQQSQQSENGRQSGDSNNSSNAATTNNNRAETGATATSDASGSGASLLAALLGLSSLEEDAQDESGNNNSTTGGGSGFSRTASGGWRRYNRRQARNNHRLTAEDLEVPDPGSMESVRQGLLTLHTLLPMAERQQQSQLQQPQSLASSQEEEALAALTAPPGRTNPLQHSRRWYLGQWIDCRDTVNQWLEATIVDIVRPEEILPPSALQNNNNRTTNYEDYLLPPAVDPAVGATDFDGRRRLLLEPIEDDEDDSGGDDLGGELAGYRPRASNDNCLLLLIHYNGWPHRWDEWIRSDSERIRPFRVRTRHPTSSHWASPTTQSHYAESPATYFSSNAAANADEPSDVADRSLLLNELVRVTTAVNALAQQAAQTVPLPTTAAPQQEDGQQEEEEEETVVARDLPWLSSAAARSEPRMNHPDSGDSSPNAASAAASLEMLAPLLDRLGRTLVDAAPHVASLAAAQRNAADQQQAEELGLMATASTDDEAVLDDTSATPESEPNNHNNSTATGTSNNPNTLGGLLSLLNRDRTRRNSRTSQSQLTDQALTHVSDATTAVSTGGNNNNNNGGSSPALAPSFPVDPDYMDFATGLVNVTRGDVRSGPRRSSSNGGGSRGEDLSGFLGAYLAAASLGVLGENAGGGGGTSGGDEETNRAGTGNNNNNNAGGGGATDLQGLGRLLRGAGGGDNNNGGGGGIDIHIHAVVTAPGMGPGGGGGGIIAGTTGLGAFGGAAAGGVGTTTATTTAATGSDLFANTRRATAQRVRATMLEQSDQDDMGIFDDLYSENPDPLTPNRGAAAAAEASEGGGGDDAGGASESNGEDVPVGSGSNGSSRRGSPPRRLSRRGNSGNPASSGGNNSNNNLNGSSRSSFLGRFFRRSGAPE